MGKNELLRRESPQVRQTAKKENFYYGVDCREPGWTG